MKARSIGARFSYRLVVISFHMGYNNNRNKKRKPLCCGKGESLASQGQGVCDMETMTVLKIIFVALLCLPIVVAAFVFFGKLMDQIVGKKAMGKK